MKTKVLKTKVLAMLICMCSIVVAQPKLSIVKQSVDRSGKPTFVKFNTKAKSALNSNVNAVLAETFNMSKNDAYQTLRVEKDIYGFTHERFQQYYQGIKVEHGVCIVHSRNNIIESLSGEYKLIPNINTKAKLDVVEANKMAKAFVNAEKYMSDENPDINFKPELVIVANDFGKHPKDHHEMVLAYKIDVYAINPLSRAFIYVDAHNGKIVHKNDIIKHAVATGTVETRYSGTKTIKTDSYNGSYRLRDYSRGNGIETYDMNMGINYSNAVDFIDSDNNWTAAEWDNANKDNAAFDAQWGAQMTYDYFNSVYSRNSFDNNGATIKSYVHFDLVEYGYPNNDNAFWDGQRMTYGDGTSIDPLTTLDIAAHEIGHAVCTYTADLTYSYESGALNEAYSDIWAACVENYAAPEKDTWILGEDLGITVRSLSNPNDGNQPDTYGGSYWATGSADNGGVHTNSGVLNHWFYILSVGKTGTNDNGDSFSVTGIGIDKAGAIAYRTESQYLTSSSNYADCRTKSIQAAEDLYGAGSDEVIQTTNAFYAVGVGDAYDNGTVDPSLYCESKGSDFSYEWIAKVEVGSFSKSSGGAAYSDFTSSTIDLTAGETYAIALTPGFANTTYNEYWKIWIDYNNDTVFDANELAFDAGALSKNEVTGTITIPANLSGIKRMRVSMKYNGEQDACETFSYGEVEDYHVNISTAVADTEAPTAPSNLTAGSVTSSSCNLSWTASSDNIGVDAYNIYKDGVFMTSTESTSYQVSALSASTVYSFKVYAEDAAGNISPASNNLSVTTLDNTINYCASNGKNSSYEWIDYVALGNMTNTTGNDGGYADYTNKLANIALGENTIYISCGFSSSSYTEYWHVWIDLNHDGTFSDNERLVYGSSSKSTTLSATFTIPTSATLGTTRMRVSMKYNAAATPCESFSYGEVEDYTVNIGATSFGLLANSTVAANELGLDATASFNVYPNPVKHMLNIEFNGEQAAKLTVYDVTGRKVYFNNNVRSGEHLDVSTLKSGYYTLIVNDGQKQLTTKFNKQ